MTELIELLPLVDTVLKQTLPKIASRLQPGLTHTNIQEKTAAYSWVLPQDAYNLYQWHDGLSGTPGKLNLAQKLIRFKEKWHGQLSGRENEIHWLLGDRLIIAKFLPLDYALAGHRHLKLGKCAIDLLPIFILNDGKQTMYCMMRLDATQPIVYCANGTNLPPIRVTESFLATQPQFSRLSDAFALLITYCQQAVTPNLDNLTDAIDFEIDREQLAQ
ncbi:hypothetical protein [Aliterella atlantica]|uniref:hypothetical protein n=1 Tax=Aliterella atlantica TaxID=1827278 RepID=UPI0006982307|nr:hypothetical protein [Aliterella atlantica]